MKENEANTILKAEIVHHPECSIFAEALGLAIQALEKRIPKKPIENDTNSFDCPCCNYDLKTDTGNPFGDYFLRYCDNCGQMIDWSDEI